MIGFPLYGITDADHILPPGNYDAELILSLTRLLHVRHEKHTYSLREQNIDFCQVEYSDLVDRKDSIACVLGEYLGLDHIRIEDFYVKGTRDDLKEVILNFQEVRDKLSGTVYLDMLLEGGGQ